LNLWEGFISYIDTLTIVSHKHRLGKSIRFAKDDLNFASVFTSPICAVLES
jgi:hypothetical protein